MKRYILLSAVVLTVMSAMAQETYENAKIATEDLNGTARYMGMGGAMDALGADISVIGTNPAGIGLFRKSSISASMGFVSQSDAKPFGGGHKTNVSFDQMGFVWANQINETDFVNFAFNYHKSRNFNHILSVADRLGGASITKLSRGKLLNGLLYPELRDDNGNFIGWDTNNPYVQCNQIDDILTYRLNGEDAYSGSNYFFDRSTSGYVSEYDFNLSGNVNNTFYWGITVGIHDVHYSHYSVYDEQLQGDGINVPADYAVGVEDDRIITGSGADIKLGVIFRPIEESPLRFGVSVATPTWYELTTRNNTVVGDYDGTLSNGKAFSGQAYTTGADYDYKFKLFTPWKFGLSVGHTIGTQLALGACYEFADYTTLDSRYITSGDNYDTSSESDQVMNRHTASTLKGVSTIKLGGEFRPDPALAIRLGYNYVSPMYDKDGTKDGALDSDGVTIASATDFVNWDATHRITCGMGYQTGDWNLSVAYQYTTQNGKFEPFESYTDVDPAYTSIPNRFEVSNKRHQLLFTATYSF